MTFQEWNIHIFRAAKWSTLIPMQLKRTYPCFSMVNGQLCAAFIGFPACIQAEEVEVSAPRYYLKIAYPAGKLLSFENFPLSNTPPHTSSPRSTQAMKELIALCDLVLKLYEEASAELERTMALYNALLLSLLEPEQTAVFKFYSRETAEA